MNNWIPVIVILAVLAGGGYYAYRKIKRKVEDVSQALFGTDSLVEGWNKQADELAATPKSVSGMTRIFEPQIQRDFPDFNLVQFKNKAENMLVSALQAIDSGNVSLIRDASEELKAQVENRIEMNRSEGIREVYEKIRIHRTEISNYMARATITQLRRRGFEAEWFSTAEEAKAAALREELSRGAGL